MALRLDALSVVVKSFEYNTRAVKTDSGERFKLS